MSGLFYSTQSILSLVASYFLTFLEWLMTVEKNTGCTLYYFLSLFTLLCFISTSLAGVGFMSRKSKMLPICLIYLPPFQTTKDMVSSCYPKPVIMSGFVLKQHPDCLARLQSQIPSFKWLLCFPSKFYHYRKPPYLQVLKISQTDQWLVTWFSRVILLI